MRLPEDGFDRRRQEFQAIVRRENDRNERRRISGRHRTIIIIMSNQLLEAGRQYWDLTAETYDQVFPETLVGRAMRGAVWTALEQAFQSGQRVLELNCGTGIDAVHLAERGVRVLACDLSPRMTEIAAQRGVANDVAEL